MNFLTPLAFTGLLLAVPILLMYMLRLRRREVNISSTFLWQQVIQDTEANTPWQRLRRNLLLFLQLLILALLVFTLARPFIFVDAVSAGQVTVLLDASASMNATDADGRSRFAAARDEALDIVDTLSAGDEMTVIRVAEVPEVLAAATSDRVRLRDAINAAQPGQAVSDWDAALNLAVAGSAGADDFSLVIIGDGGLPADLSLRGVSGEVRYIPVGTSTQNVAISALSTAARPGQSPELFALITNYGAVEARVTFSLFVDGTRFTAENLDIPPGAEQPIVSSALPEAFSVIEARLTQRVNALADDHLALDDVAYAVAAADGRRRVLMVSDGNIFIEEVLRSLPGIEAVRTEGATGIPEGFDLYLFDGIVPPVLPPGDLMFINPQANTPYFSLGGETENTANPRLPMPDDPRVDQIGRVMDVDQLNFLRIRQVGDVDWADRLLVVDGGPVLLAGEVDGRQIALMPLDLRNSDLPLQLAWPALMWNLTTWFTPRAAIDLNDSLATGETLTIRPPVEADAVRVIPPEGAPASAARTLPVDRSTLIYADTDTPGVYTLQLLSGQTVLGEQPFAVNLFSQLESAIAPVPEDSLQIEGAAVNVLRTEERGQRELWPWVALLALAFLLVEWVAYHRRLRVPTVFRPVPGTTRPASAGAAGGT
ncbi:MAG: BatA domain-containing protein [Chloroflexota bacterium]